MPLLSLNPSRFAFIALTALVVQPLSLRTAVAQAPDTTTLGTVVISASKSPTARASLTQAVTVLSGNDLRARGVSRVSDALREVPGASVVQTGSFGSLTTMFLRGGESRYTKVLIDGVAVNAPGGFFDFSHLTTDNIERIEIVRGPGSVLYGADAVSGIVQIFTRRGRGPLSLGAEARAGTYRTVDGSADLSGSSGKARYSAAAAQHRTDGVISFNNQYYNGTLSASAGFTPSPGTDALLSARYTMAEFHYPTDFTGAPVDSNSYRVQHRFTVGLDARTRLTDAIDGRVLLGNNEVSDLTEDIAVPFGGTTPRHSALFSRNSRRTVEGRLIFRLPVSATLNIGAEYLREREASTNGEGAVGEPTTPTSTFHARRSNTAAYSELTGNLSRVSYVLSARVDDNSDYDAFTSYRIGASAPLAPSTRVRGSLSTAFNAPAFNQLRPTLYTAGSPDLSPERTRSFEIGAEQMLLKGMLRVAADYFNQRFTDLIQFVAGGPPNFLGSYANLTGAKSNGYDIELSARPVKNFSGTVSYTQATPVVTTLSPLYAGDLTVGQALVRRPTHSGNATLRYGQSERGSLSATVGYVGKRPDLDFNEFPALVVTLPAYVKVDLSGVTQIFRSASGRSTLSLTARVENALDKRYEDVLHFAAPGRTVLLGARFAGGL